jgi:hypothetical protein
MAIELFELNKLFMSHVPELIMFCHGFQQALQAKMKKWVLDVGSQQDKA